MKERFKEHLFALNEFLSSGLDYSSILKQFPDVLIEPLCIISEELLLYGAWHPNGKDLRIGPLQLVIFC